MGVIMPIKHGKGNKINLPKYMLTSDGRMPPPNLRFSAPGIDFSKYTYKELIELDKRRQNTATRKTPGRVMPKTKHG
jgi:hypothetical protein